MAGFYTGDFFHCTLSTRNMFNCTSSASLAHNHRLCSCYVEPYSDPTCLSIHFHTEWHHIRAIRFSNSLRQHNCYLWYGLKGGQMSMATSAVIGLLKNSADCMKTRYVNNENNIINVRAHGGTEKASGVLGRSQ